ncbi:unnamed protein product [Anisakis simplex]|uniref:VID27 domain-containing protein n=1 Tax=Anisakis simplex TaxID=6269 RepID=A0A0M3KB35_ANISI|nr:unnamed protein product [Anisakis simplex]
MSDVIRYTKIEINDGGDETRKFGVRSEYSSPTSLYEVMTMATITGDIDEIDDDTAIELPIIRSASNGADFAVIINNDLSLFDFSFTFKFVYPKEEKQMVQAAMLGTNEANYKFVEFMDRDDRNGDVYALSCMNDRYMLEVCEEGYLTIWDMATMIQLVKKRIVSEGESIKAFKILEGQQTLQEITLILIVYNQNNAKTELQIRSLKSAELAYALSVPIDTDLLAFAPNEEFSIMIVEPYGFAPRLLKFSLSKKYYEHMNRQLMRSQIVIWLRLDNITDIDISIGLERKLPLRTGLFHS